MLKCDVCSPVNFLHIFKTHFPKNTSERLLLPLKNDRKCFLTYLESCFRFSDI